MIIPRVENLIFDKRMCKVSAKQRMKYCTSDNDEIKFKDIIKNDSKNLKKHKLTFQYNSIKIALRRNV